MSNDLLNKVKAMSLDDVYALAVKQLHACQLRNTRNKKYTDKNRQKCSNAALRCYYKNRDMYHPELNPNGLVEKKFKREVI
jgi:hypothetical protein